MLLTQPHDLSLYIHWPFCLSKCPYCDFNSHVRERIDEGRWEKALLRELHDLGERTQGRFLKSVFFGGGTPSLMSAKTVDKIISTLGDYWQMDEKNLEITLEANPGTFETGKFRDFKHAGINRLSLGVQSLDDDVLKFLGRVHGREQALHALKEVEKIYDRFSFDLIYARPHQTPQEWTKELKEALSFAGGHLSLYQLTIEPGTAFYAAYKRKDWVLPNEEESSVLYEVTESIMAAVGMPPYEVSNYAVLGQESQHNLRYWSYQDYGGVGPGAHGRLTREGKKYATRTLKVPETWLERVENNRNGLEEERPLTRTEVIEEKLIMGLRLTKGISLELFEKEIGIPFDTVFPKNRIHDLCEEGLMMKTPFHLFTTLKGRQCLNAILDYLLGEKNISRG